MRSSSFQVFVTWSIENGRGRVLLFSPLLSFFPFIFSLLLLLLLLLLYCCLVVCCLFFSCRCRCRRATYITFIPSFFDQQKTSRIRTRTLFCLNNGSSSRRHLVGVALAPIIRLKNLMGNSSGAPYTIDSVFFCPLRLSSRLLFSRLVSFPLSSVATGSNQYFLFQIIFKAFVYLNFFSGSVSIRPFKSDKNRRRNNQQPNAFDNKDDEKPDTSKNRERWRARGETLSVFFFLEK